MTSIKAQDVYTGSSSSSNKAAIYKNGEMLYQVSDYYNSATTAVVVDPNTNDVYYIGKDGWNTGTVFKNDEYFGYLSTTYGSDLRALAFGNNGLYTAGYYYDEMSAAVWLNDNPEPLYILSIPGYETNGLGIYVERGGNVYTCGYAHDSDNDAYYGVVWRDGVAEPIVAIDDAWIADVTYYDGHVYSLGITNVSMETCYLEVFKDGSPLYTLSASASLFLSWFNDFRIKFDAGNLYVAGLIDANHACIWKNGQVLYEFNNMYFSAFDVTPDGVFYVNNVDNQNYVYKNGQQLFQLNNDITYDLFVDESCTDNDARPLPFVENFNSGTTDWNCWTKTDEFMNWDSDHEYTYASYWNRIIYDEYNIDNQCVYHKYNSDFDQEGWLISPKLAITNGMDAVLTFNTYEEYPNDVRYEGVLVSTTGTAPGNFTEVWTQNDASSQWKEVTIDLTQFSGHNIYIAFKYAGTNGHSWYIDDISVSEYLGVTDVEASQFAVYPNPANESIRISGIESETEVSIYNATGALVKVVNVNVDGNILISELPTGLYIARFGENSLRFTKE